MEGWIKIHRKLLDWEWYSDANMTRLWIHLLLSVNYEPKEWRGIAVGAGQILTSISQLSVETGLTTKQVRVCLERLKLTNELAIKTTNKYTLLTICKFEDYQVAEEDEGQTEGQTKGKQNGKQKGKQRASTTTMSINELVDGDDLMRANKVASERATTKEDKKYIEKDISNDISKKINPPSLQEREQSFYNSLIPFVEIYGKEMIRNFYNYWSQVNPNGKKMLWEMQRVFDIKKRLVTWSNNETKKPDTQKTKMDMYQESLQKIIRGERL